MAALGREQRLTLAGMIAAVVVTAATLVLAPPALVALLPVLPGAAERVAFAARAELLLALPLALAIAVVARLRFFSAADIAGAAFTTPTRPVAVANAVLQNTLEQTALAVPVHLGLAATLAPHQLGAVPALVALFLVGRLAFAIGYARGAAARAFGFALTFYPTLAALGWGIARLIG